MNERGGLAGIAHTATGAANVIHPERTKYELTIEASGKNVPPAVAVFEAFLSNGEMICKPSLRQEKLK